MPFNIITSGMQMVPASSGGGLTPNVINNQRLVNQGGNTNDKSHAGGNVTFGQSIYFEPPIGGALPDTYVLQISTLTPGNSVPSGWFDLQTQSHTGAPHYIFTDNATQNIYNATNIQEDFGSASPTPIGPTTIAAYRVLASANGVRGPAPTQMKMMFYEGASSLYPAWNSATTYLIGDRVFRSGNNYYLRNATSLNQDPITNGAVWWQLFGGNQCNGPSYALNFGISGFNDANAITGGTDVIGTSTSGQGGIQLAVDAPLTWVYGGEIGAFCPPFANGFFTIDIKPSRNGMILHFAFHTRAPTGDVEPNINSLDLSNYGPAPVGGVWATYRIPLADLAFGVSTATCIIVGGVATISNISGPGIDAGAQLAGPNITQGTWFNTSPSQTRNGNYAVSGQTDAASGPVVIYHTSAYKWQVGLANANVGDGVELNNYGVVLS